MKSQTIYQSLLVAAALLMSACTTDPEEIFSGNDAPPAGATPSAEFTENNLSDEPYAEDAIRIVATDAYAPFYAIELMPDGHYLLNTYRPYNSYAASVRVTAQADGGFAISKRRKDKTTRTGSFEDENGTVTLSNGAYYGEFTKLGDKQYRLSNGDEIDLTEATGSDQKVTYRGLDGRVSNVYVSTTEPIGDFGTKSLCRTWNYNSFELWAYWNGHYIVHGKQTLTNGVVNTEFNVMGDDSYEKDDYLDDDDEFCYKVIFTSAGTYICFYINGDVEVSRWRWTEMAQGTLYYNHSETDDFYEGDGYVTVRFAGKQMRVYEDYTDSEDGENERIVIVNTLTAAY